MFDDSKAQLLRGLGGLFVALVSMGLMAYLGRKKGKSWNEIFAPGEKLFTGNVWKDGVIFAAILVGLCLIVFALIFYYPN